MLTAVGIWRDRVGRTPGEVAYRHHEGGGWRATTWAEADRAAREIAAGLAALGVAPGDRVALLADTRLEWCLFDVGCVLAGAVPVPIYPSSTAAQCAFIVANAGARVALAENTAQVAKLAPLAAVEHLFQIDGGDQGRVGSLGALRAIGHDRLISHPGEIPARTAAVGPDWPFTIIHTSGTTGDPKGVVLSHGNLAAAVDSAIAAFTVEPDDHQYLLLPLAHVLGRELAWIAVQVGAPTWFSRGVPLVKDDMLDCRPTFLAAVPRLFEKMHAAVEAALASAPAARRALTGWAIRTGHAATAADGGDRGRPFWLRLAHRLADRLVLAELRRRMGLDRCRFLISGGAPLAPALCRFFHALGLLVLEGYGLTESVGAAFVNRPHRFRIGTVGPPLDAVEARIERDGEILLRGPTIFRGYHRNPTATAEVIDADGWFHTGDVGQLEDGFLRITDRKKDLIVTAGGKNVAPQPIENALKAASRLVGEAIVCGDRRPYCVVLVAPSDQAVQLFGAGDRAAAAASPALLAALGRDIEELNRTLAPFETLKRFAILGQELSEQSGDITSSLKVKRARVVEKYRTVIDDLYARGARPEEKPSHGQESLAP